MSFTRLLQTFVLCALFAPSVLAQSKPAVTLDFSKAQPLKLAVNVVGDNAGSERIAQAVTARIGSTTRYTSVVGAVRSLIVVET